MTLFVVDSEKCKRDAICVSECPMRIIEMKDKDAPPTPVDQAEELCVRCGHCVAVCPHGALSLSFMAPDQCRPVQRDLMPSFDQTAQLIRSRRATRVYKEKQVDREKLENILDVVHYAPTAKNTQLVGWLIINNREEVKRLAGLVIDWMRSLVAANNPLARALRMDRILGAWKNGADMVLRAAPALVIAHAPKDYPFGLTDCVIALTTFELAASAAGLGTCWAGFFSMAANNWPPLPAGLDLPAGRIHFSALMLGYPKHGYARQPLRNEAQVIWR